MSGEATESGVRLALADEPASRPVVASERAYSGKIFGLDRDTVAFDDGEAVRDYLVHPGAVGILALDDDDNVLLVQQYRHPVRALLWEPPAGLLDAPGEDPLVTAQRELFEETHHHARDWNVLVDVTTSPGCSNEATRIFLARGVDHLGDAERHAGTAEEADMPTRWEPLDEVVARVLAGDLHNVTLLVGALAAHAARARGWADLRPPDAPWPLRSPGYGVGSTDSGPAATVVPDR